MGHTNTKKMVQGAMIAAIFGALSLINTYTGSMFDIFICYGMTLPLVWYGYQYKLKDNIIVCIVSIIVIALMGIPLFVISSIAACLSGLFIGEALKKKAKKETLLLGTFIVSFVNNILLYEVFAKLLDINLVSEMKEVYQGMVSVVPNISHVFSLDAWMALIPIVLIVMSVLEMYVIIMLCQLVLVRLKVDFPGSFHLASMHLGKKTGLCLLIGMFGGYILENVFNLDYVILSYIYILCLLTIALEGLAFLCYALIVKGHVKWMVLGFVGLFIPGLNMVYIILGIIDIFSDLRGNLLYNKNSKN